MLATNIFSERICNWPAVQLWVSTITLEAVELPDFLPGITQRGWMIPDSELSFADLPIENACIAC